MLKRIVFFIISLSLIINQSCKPPKEYESQLEKPKVESSQGSTDTVSDFKDWVEYSIKGFGEISIPPEMEEQSGKFKEFNEKNRHLNGFSEEQIVFQQKGLNKFESDSKNTYARVMIKTIIGKKGEYSDLSEAPISNSELEDFEGEYKKEFEKNMKKQNINITKWYPIQIADINGNMAILTSYNRTLSNNPEAYVRMYQFFNNDRYHFVTLSFRITEKEKWETLFDKILNKIKIVEIE